MTDLGDLERTFKDYTGNLPDYKRREVYAYVNALKAEIAKRDKEIDELSNHLVEINKKLDTLESTENEHYDGPY